MKKFYLLLTALLVSVAANAADWYLCGLENSWGDNEKYKLTQSATNPDESSIKVESLSGEIKVKEAGSDWSSSFGAAWDNGKKLSLKEGVVYNAGNDGQNIPVEGTITNATLTINTSNHTIRVTGNAQENDYDCVYLIGNFVGGGDNWSETITDYPLNLKEGTTNTYEGTYTLNAQISYFKLKAGTNIYATGGNDIPVEFETPYTTPRSGNAFSIGKGTFHFTFVLDKNADSGQLTVTTSTPVTYPDLVVIGSFCNWKFADAKPMERENNKYTAVFETIEANTEFKIVIKQDSEDWSNSTSWGGNGSGKDENGNDIPETLVHGQFVNAWASSSVNFKIAEKYSNAKIIFAYEPAGTSQICFEGVASGVENITVEGNDEAPYYNLQGMPIANPQPGNVYIYNGKKLIFR